MTASGCIEPTRDTIADGSYPLSRTLYIYVNKEKIASNPALKAFVDFYLSDDGREDGGRAGRLRRPSGRPDRRHPIGVGVGCCVALSTSPTVYVDRAATPPGPRGATSRKG